VLRALALTLLSIVGAAEPADQLPPGPPKRQELDLLRKLSVEDPEAAERAIGAAIARIPGETGFEQARAELFDLRGQSLTRMNRLPEAADAFHAALAFDEGTSRLTWTLEDGRPAWTAAIDPGDGRLERAARSYLAAKRTDAVRPVLAHALAAGAEGWTREAWALVGGGSVPGLDASASELTAGGRPLNPCAAL
jgi:hypothetical protein